VFTKILILGNSVKFKNLIKKIYPKSFIEIIGWRKIEYFLRDYNFKKKFKIIFICGYDYNSNLYNYEKYYKINILNPLKFLKKIVKINTQVIYINTNYKPNKHATFSRYEFAKIKLGIKIKNKFKKTIIMNVNTILNKDGKPDIYGGVITRYIFYVLAKNKIIETCSHKALFSCIKKFIKKKCSENNKSLIPKFLFLKRTLFLDRVLRLVNV
jgi:hypothetical protein